MKVIQVQVNMLCVLTMRKTWQLQFDIISFIKGSFAMSWYFTGVLWVQTRQAKISSKVMAIIHQE